MISHYTGKIQKGSTGDDVKKGQRYLKDNGYDLDVDGIFGDATKTATYDFQVSNGLASDGIVGDETWGLAGFTKYGADNSTGSTSTGSGNTSTSKPPSYTPTATPNVGPAPTAPTFNNTPTALPTIDTTMWDETEKGAAALGNYNTAKDAVDNYGDFTYEDYKESEKVQNAGNALNDHLANKPSEYKSQWTAQLDALMKQIIGREKFSYNFNDDALYQQYKDKYVEQGKMMMGDAIGQASAMTGGYGNSYAQSVGQQAYQQSLDNLNDIVPELYKMALDKYNMEGQDLLNQYGLVMDREDMDYGRYRDIVADWMTNRGYLQGVYDSERNFDYGKYVDDRNMDHALYQEGYQKLLDALGIASDDYYKGGDIFRTEQASKNNESWNQYYATEEQRKDSNNLLQQGYQNDLNAWEAEYNRAWDEYNANESANRYQNEEAWRNAEGDRDSLEETTGGTGNTGNTGNTTMSAAIPDEVKQKSSTFKSNTDLNNYLAGLENSEVITPEQSDALFAQYKQPDNVSLSERDWKLDGDGGTNWFWGIDNNATVKDQYGNIYRLDKLVDALVAEGMDKSAAKDYVKKLQKKLGA